MGGIVAVILREPRARWFLLANAQSAIGSGAASVALVIIAYQRLHSPWAITFALLADFLPAMLLGPVFGAAADRWSRRGCAVVADVLRAGAFVGIALVHSYAATVAFAFLGGIGTALFSPAVLAALPSLGAPERSAAITSLYGATRDVGRTLGPVLAAAALPVLRASDLMIVNGATFAVSALAIALVPFGGAGRPAGGGRRLLADAREGLSVTMRLPGVATVVWTSTAVILFAAMVNVGELLLARKLGADASQFALLAAAAGVGVVLGSVLGARPAEPPLLKRRYLAGVLLTGVSVAALALAPNYGVALVAFFASGVGNGTVVVHERLIFQAVVPDALLARAFALLDTVGGWGFAAAFVGAGALIAALGTRATFGFAGVSGVVVFAVATFALRGVWRGDARPGRNDRGLAGDGMEAARRD